MIEFVYGTNLINLLLLSVHLSCLLFCFLFLSPFFFASNTQKHFDFVSYFDLNEGNSHIYLLQDPICSDHELVQLETIMNDDIS